MLLFFMSEILWILFSWEAVKAVTNVAETRNSYFVFLKQSKEITEEKTNLIGFALCMRFRCTLHKGLSFLL
jgi:hypothetical protein